MMASARDWWANLGPDQLDRFITYVDENGGPSSAHFAAIAPAFRYLPGTQVNQELDPFGTQYFEQMVALYRELSGRDLDQDTGEHTDFDHQKSLRGANPYGSDDIAFISKHARAVLTSIMIANPAPGAKVLDLGCGWGLSTEMLAFTGAEITAVDINPNFVKLVRERAKQRGLDVTTIRSNFDDLTLEAPFDVAFFYECLHHARKPWETIEKIIRFAGPEARVIFAGEPVNAIWWKHWGLRLDALSIYCIRKFGWFESGWSEAFIKDCFARCDWDLSLYGLVGLNDGIIGVAERHGGSYARPIRLPTTAIHLGAPKPPSAPAPAEPLFTPAVIPPTQSFEGLRKLKRRLFGQLP